MYYFIEVACVIMELWVIHMFIRSFFPKKEVASWICWLFYILFGSLITVLSLTEDMAFVRLGAALIGVWACTQLLFQAKPLQGLIAAVAFCAIVAVTDVVTALAFECCGMDTNLLMENHISRSLYLIANHFVLLGLMMLVCSINHRTGGEVPAKILLPISPCWIISIILCFLLTWQNYEMGYEWHPLFLIVLIGLLYTNIIVIYYINRSNERAQIQKNLEIAEHHYAMQQEYYDQLRVQQEETRALWHDISKYLRASKVESSESALTQVQQMLDSISCVVDVNNRVVSVILNEYFQTVQSAQIKLDMDVQVPEELFVTAADLYVLIGNTMDNAIDACQVLSLEQRRISLKLKTHNNILFYEISNPYTEDYLHRIRNRYHGYGLKNVERCVRKYNGQLDISKRNGIFRVVAHLNSL